MEKIVFTDHALFEMKHRGLPREIIEKIITEPEQQWEVRKGRMVLQSRIPFGDTAEIYLVRVFMDIDRNPPEIVTAYKTSKIEKYWRGEK